MPVADGDGPPSRDAAIAAEVWPATAALVDLTLPSANPGDAPFVGVIVSGDGLVLAPAVRLGKQADSERSVNAGDIVVAGNPHARCTAIVAVRGELALLRFAGLVDGKHRPIGPGSKTALGALVAAINPGDARPSFGFVTAELRHPGTVAPDGPRWGCGLVHRMFERANPPVEVGAALATDAGWSRFGSLLVDRSGRPVGIEVANRAPGLVFAVPWSDVLERFRAWLP